MEKNIIFFYTLLISLNWNNNMVLFDLAYFLVFLYLWLLMMLKVDKVLVFFGFNLVGVLSLVIFC